MTYVGNVRKITSHRMIMLKRKIKQPMKLRIIPLSMFTIHIYNGFKIKGVTSAITIKKHDDIIK